MVLQRITIPGDRRGRCRRSEAIERPVVQKQQHERQRNHHRLGQQPQRKQEYYRHITVEGKRMAHIAHIRPECQHEKQATEHILAFRHPRHRFNPQRMDRKHRRHKRAAPQKPSHPPQHQKQEDHRGGVQQDVRQMMPAGIQPIQPAVQHV